MVLAEAAQMHTRYPVDMDAKARGALAKSVRRVTILKTLWYPEIIESLEASARRFLDEVGVEGKKVRTLEVGGALELPLATDLAAASSDFIVVLGCVVNGQTPHFDFVCQSAFDGLMSVQLKKQVPVGNGILTVDSLAQAEARREKGFEAAHAAFIQLFVKSKLLKKLQRKK